MMFLKVNVSLCISVVSYLLSALFDTGRGEKFKKITIYVPNWPVINIHFLNSHGIFTNVSINLTAGLVSHTVRV